MSDYIKREDAERMFMEYLCAEYHIYALNDDIETDRRIKTAIKISKEMFSHLKSADVAPVVRCRDCRWWDKEREQCGITPSSSPYGHCHDGETLEHSMIKDAGR